MIPDRVDENRQQIRAYYPGARIHVRDIPGLEPTDSRAYVLKLENDGAVYIFRYGVIVFFDVTLPEQIRLLELIKDRYLSKPFDISEDEDAHFVVNAEAGDKVFFEYINIREKTPERFELISDVIAKSCVLDYYERQAAEIFDILEPMANVLQSGGYPTNSRAKMYLKHIGLALAMQRNMIGQVEITDKPEVLWEQPPAMHRFYARLEDEYEIIERHKALKEKLDVIHHTAETMVNLLQTRQSLRVEWYIVILIVFDILMSLGEKAGFM